MAHVHDLQKRLLAFLKRRHTGRTNATPSRALEARFCVCGSTLRRAVLLLRRDGHPICSDRCGYYYAADGRDLWDTIGRMESRLTGSASVVRGLRKAALPMTGQTRLNE